MKNQTAESAVAQTPELEEPFSNQPEFELLLCSARTVPDAARIEELVGIQSNRIRNNGIRNNGAGIDWRAFLELATEHRVRLLVYKSLRATCWDRVPGNIQREWTELYQALTGRNLFITGELIRINAQFEAAGIPVAVLKGAVIAEIAYGEFALREFGDLDLLIREEDFSRAIELLRRLSYEPTWKYDNRKVLRFLRHVGEYVVTSDLWQTEVDLHWRVATKATALSPSVSDFPSGFQPLSIAGSTVLSFAPQDLPLYLAAQGGWDQWCDLRRICDLAEFLRRYPEVSWEPSLDAAQRLGGLRSMLTGLALAADLLGAALPESIVSRIRGDSVVSRLAEKAIENLRGNASGAEAVRRYTFQLQAKQGARGKIALAYSILMDRTAKDGSWIMLPRPLWWLYAVLRPLRMSGKALRD